MFKLWNNQYNYEETNNKILHSCTIKTKKGSTKKNYKVRICYSCTCLKASSTS